MVVELTIQLKVFSKGQTPSTAPQIYWRAPSIGFNAGASASQVAILVYGANQYEQLLQRFASIQGSYHLVVGVGVSYLRSTLDPNEQNPISLAYITVGVGFDAGVAVESLAFSKKERSLAGGDGCCLGDADPRGPYSL